MIEKPDIFVIIGNNHSGAGKDIAVYPDGKWETPLGEVDVDAEFANEIIENSKFAEFDREAHRYEHSIEVQLPFLQFVFKKIKIVPIAFSGEELLEEAKDLANAIDAAAKKLKKKIFVIASSDFTHYGAGYGYLPFMGSNEEIKKRLYELDNNAIKQILGLHEMNFFRYVTEKHATICGVAPILAAIFYAKKFVKEGKLLKYYCSGDISEEYENSVGYASIIF